MKIERLKSERWDEFAELCTAMHAESAFASWPISLDRVREYIARQNVFCVVAINDAGRMVGLCVAAIGSFFFSPRQVVDLALLYVSPENRGGRAAKRLVESLEQWAVSRGIPDVQLSQRTGVDIDKTARFFEGCGYKLSGFSGQRNCNVLR